MCTMTAPSGTVAGSGVGEGVGVGGAGVAVGVEVVVVGALPPHPARTSVAIIANMQNVKTYFLLLVGRNTSLLIRISPLLTIGQNFLVNT